MTEFQLGSLFVVGTLFLLLSGMSVAFALGVISLLFMLVLMPPSLILTLPQTLYGGLDNFTLLAIPLFILMGEAIGRTRASVDLYECAYRWLHKLPGGLGIANVIGCAIFAGMCGSSTATAAAMGSMGIPEMKKRGYAGGLAGGLIAAGGTLGILIPPSITFILYGIVSEQSIGKLFIAGIIPGLLLATFFAVWVGYKAHRDNRLHAASLPANADTGTGIGTSTAAGIGPDTGATATNHIYQETFTWGERFASLPRLIPFAVIIFIVMVALYGGFATPSEVAGVGAFATVVMVMLVYRCYRWKDLGPILLGTTKESCMLMMIIAMSFLYSNVMSYLHITQSATHWMVGLEMSKWEFLFWIDILILALGFFLPPVAIILFITPVLLPGLQAHGFDLVWFGVQMTILMEAGLIHPPIGLNLFVILGIAPDISLKELLWGVTPFIIMIVLFIVLLCVFPQLALWLPGQM